MDLGQNLFERKGKKLVLNDFGKIVSDYSTKIFRYSEEMINYVQQGPQFPISILNIGLVPWVAKDLVYNFLRPTLFNQHIKVEVFQNNIESLIEDLLMGKIDLVLNDSPYTGRSTELQGHFISKDPIVCVSSQSEQEEPSFPKNINYKKFINFSEACKARDDIDSFIKDHQLEITTAGEFADSTLIRIAAEQGGIIAFLPKCVVQRSIKTKQLFQLGELKGHYFTLYALVKKTKKTHGLIADLLKTVAFPL